MSESPAVGRMATITSTVDAGRTASALAARPDESLPNVFGTPFMIAEMERACADLLAPTLEAGEASVGVNIDVRHLAPTPVGAEINVSARYTGREGALFWFDVWADDPGGRIGEGRMARAIVIEEKLLARAEKRRA